MTAHRSDWTQGQHRLLLDACTACGDTWYLPRRSCPTCGACDPTTVTSSQEGRCVAVTRLHATPDGDGPVALCLVRLDEGPLVLGQAHDSLRPGHRAAIEFRTVGNDNTLVPYVYRKA